VPDEDDGTGSGVGSMLISDWCEESQDELLVPIFLRALPALFVFFHILQKNRYKQKLVENVREKC